MNAERVKNLGVLKAVLDHFEGDKAVFLLSDGQRLEWNKNDLPHEFKKGDEVVFKIASLSSELKKREEIARKLLGEILNKAK